VSATTEAFQSLLATMGSDVTFHREEGGVFCPCRTPEGFRSPAWHKAHPIAPVCNEQAVLAPDLKEYQVLASIQPIRSATRRITERATELFGVIEQDDHLGIFPVEWNGNRLDFSKWSEAGEDFIVYDNRRFTVVAADKLPDVDGDPDHHWEVGLRLLKPEAQRPV
jgi:hypothetical protein